ncbi:MAG: energy-coupling factor transporter transmembrane component T [Candidatus Omnitrophota bacterium]|nr:energy-coupling factor transporter transmembrane component T [Candidatus Omnitrophota bacterium]
MKIIRNFNPRQKLALIILSALFAITTDNYCLMGGYLVFLTVLFLSAGIDGRRKKVWIAALLLTWWGTIFSQSIFYAKMPKTAIFVIVPQDFPLLGSLTGGVNIYREGAEYGLVQAMRFGITITCGLLICFTTEAKDILRAVVRIRLPYALGFMVSVGLRFIPLIVEETRTVISAQRMRGFKPLRSGVVRPIATARIVLVPVLVNAIRRSAMLSLSVESRHFGKKQAFYIPQEKTRRNALAAYFLIMLGIIIGLMAVAKSFYFLYISNYFYMPELRLIYDIADKYL